MRAGRKHKMDKPITWKVNVPSSIAIQVELLLLDSVTGKVQYSARSNLIARLLVEWLEEQKA